MIAFALLYHLHLYLFGFERTRIRTSDGGEMFFSPVSIRKVNRIFTRALQTREFVEAYRHNRRMSRVVLNPMQMAYWEEV